MSTIKRGLPNKSEVEFVSNFFALSDEELAQKLNRSINVIRKIRRRIAQERGLSVREAENRELTYSDEITLLRERPYYKDLQNQYTAEELKMVEYHWATLKQQFKEITHTEELQILLLINLQTLINRNLAGQNRSSMTLDKYEQELAEEMRKPVEQQDSFRKASLTETYIPSLRDAIKGYNQEYKALLERYAQVMRDLKSTRDQRLKEVENGKKTFFDFLKTMQDATQRRRESQEMELVKLSVTRLADKLSETVKFEDDEYCQPFLTPDTVVTDAQPPTEEPEQDD